MELSELIESVDILDSISQYTDFTEKNGEYWALSPLKEENTPSFSVRREENTFYDFSSGVGGNVFTFIRYYHKCGYAEAVQKVNPWSAICRAIGKALNGDVIKKLDSMERQLNEHIRMDDERNTDLHRAYILRFNTELLRKIRHTEEDFNECFW